MYFGLKIITVYSNKWNLQWDIKLCDYLNLCLLLAFWWLSFLTDLRSDHSPLSFVLRDIVNIPISFSTADASADFRQKLVTDRRYDSSKNKRRKGKDVWWMRQREETIKIKTKISCDSVSAPLSRLIIIMDDLNKNSKINFLSSLFQCWKQSVQRKQNILRRNRKKTKHVSPHLRNL